MQLSSANNRCDSNISKDDSAAGGWWPPDTGKTAFLKIEDQNVCGQNTSMRERNQSSLPSVRYLLRPQLRLPYLNEHYKCIAAALHRKDFDGDCNHQESSLY
jgi:hypothetical protein